MPEVSRRTTGGVPQELPLSPGDADLSREEPPDRVLAVVSSPRPEGGASRLPPHDAAGVASAASAGATGAPTVPVAAGKALLAASASAAAVESPISPEARQNVTDDAAAMRTEVASLVRTRSMVRGGARVAPGAVVSVASVGEASAGASDEAAAEDSMEEPRESAGPE
mmetsp:Transcript_97511/g.281363  ORF Transcript_97511/g.281363 Transcript_97511/m.281363 type:complete len:168 (-) Transcript_97511:215-718(-)